ncbi:MAG: ABC transporter ATP-binding protein [Eubacterium sp.]|nr:ABC transporter ATP-binding protein [Eubacterium sp.]
MKIVNVSAGYEKNKLILKDVSTEFLNGGICGILGPNGSGKTTLLRVLAGIMPYEGDLKIDDISLKNMKHDKIGRYIAMTPQFSTIYFSYTVYETIMMGRYVHRGHTLNDFLGGTSQRDKDVVGKIIEEMELDKFKDKQVNQLSGGQLERVLLARTFAQETPVILLDEPTNHLDMKYQIELMDYLKKWAVKTTTVDGVEYKNTAISVFHDIGTAALISDEIILMKDGGIIAKGPVSEMIERDRLKEIYDTDVVGYYDQVSKLMN